MQSVFTDMLLRQKKEQFETPYDRVRIVPMTAQTTALSPAPFGQEERRISMLRIENSPENFHGWRAPPEWLSETPNAISKIALTSP